MRITFVVGLPASGKSMLLAQYTKNGAVCIDDPTDLNVVNEVLLSSKFNSVENILVADPNFCDQNVLSKAIAHVKNILCVGDESIEVIYFENDLNACLLNASNRLMTSSDKTVQQFIRQLSRIYRPGQVYPGRILKVWQP